MIFVLAANILVAGLGLFAHASTTARCSNVYALLDAKMVALSDSDRRGVDAWFGDLRRQQEWVVICSSAASMGSLLCVLMCRKGQNF
jgi:hypothetical protein